MKWLITGGGGFIGCNTSARLAGEGHEVIVFDNLSRKGAAINAEWLKKNGGIEIIIGDVRDYATLSTVIRERKPDVVLHLAGQVAVTTSVSDPRLDFEINALGTFNVCEAIREFYPEAILLNASTNKVYGAMEQAGIVEENGRYNYRNLEHGISENCPLDFHSPYGCSKGAGDQYVRDYARIYGLRTVNFRQSCIYGYRQLGVEDQGWVAWFTIAAVLGKPITIYGNGKQVRDILFIDDLIDCYIAAVKRIDCVAGETFNIGGGRSNTLSLLELLTLVGEQLGHPISVRSGPWRPGDQKIFVCDIRKAIDRLGWLPRTPPKEGVVQMTAWVQEEKALLCDIFSEGLKKAVQDV